MVTKCHITKRSHETTKRHRTEKRLANAWWWSLLNRPARPLDVRDGAFPAKPHTHHAVSSLTFCSDRAFLSLLQKEEKKKRSFHWNTFQRRFRKSLSPFTRRGLGHPSDNNNLSERPPHICQNDRRIHATRRSVRAAAAPSKRVSYSEVIQPTF